jgi:ketopantoate reductase
LHFAIIGAGAVGGYYGALLGDSKKDRALTDWLVANYGKAFY